LGKLDSTTSAVDANLPGWRWHPLKADRARCWAVWVEENWRFAFKFEGKDAVLVNHQDYH
jgi:plasmid maintenance system killer protein